MIIWLASHPKSGNIWIRLFLNSLLYDNDLDINNIKIEQFHQKIDFNNLVEGISYLKKVPENYIKASR